MDEKLVPRPDHRLPAWQRRIGGLIVLWVILGTMQSCSLPHAFRFLSSADWLDRSLTWSWIAGAVLAVLVAWLIRAGMRLQDIRQGKTSSRAKRLFWLLLSLLIGLAAGSASIRSGLPMVAAMMAGERTEMNVTVLRANRRGDNKCRRPVELVNSYRIDGEICGMSDEKHSRLSPGDRLTIVGRGTWRGVFLDEVLLPAKYDSQQHLSF